MNNVFKRISLSSVWLWLIIFAITPTLLVITSSVLQHDNLHLLKLPFTLENFTQLSNTLYVKILWRSFLLAASCTFACLILGYPFAYIIARTQSRYKSLLLLLVIIPFWTSSLIRTYAIMAILKAHGLLNTLLLGFGIIDMPLQMMYSNTAVMIGLVYNLLPFMILPIYANIEKFDNRLIEAAKDLGANRITIFFKILLPLTMPGIIAGVLFVFLPAMTMFYIPDLLGGAKSMLLGNLIENQFLRISNWPLGSAMSVALMIIMLILFFAYGRSTAGQDKKELL